MGKHRYIEIDVTNACNLRCNNCTRRMDLREGTEFVSRESVERFIEQAKDYPFRRIVIMGGEPTLHPDIEWITDQLLYFTRSKYKCSLIFVSNCHTEFAREFCNRIEESVDVRREPKTKTRPGGGARLSEFWTMNVAPIDFPEFEGVDFSRGCKQKDRCGFNRSVAGKYYACAMAAPIDEIFGFNCGADDLTELEKVSRDQLNTLCRFCGRLRLEYELGWARFDSEWKLAMFKQSKKDWPLKSSKKYLSPSWERQA